MRSIKSRFILLCVVSTLLCVLVIGGAAMLSLYRSGEHSTDQVMHLACQDAASALNAQLDSISGSVQVVVEQALRGVDLRELLSDGQYTARFLARVQPLFDSVARSTNGACTYYLRLLPDLDNSGFLYILSQAGGNFLPYPLTDITLYDQSDRGRVAWYYEPKEAGEPLWLEPYYNKNLNIYMISYVAPLYVDGTFVGVAGMDIDFQGVIEGAGSVRAYETEAFFLVGRDGTVFYHPDLEPGTSLAEAIPSLAGVVAAFETPKGESTLYRYQYNGGECRLVFDSLHNGMEMLLSVESYELRTTTDRLVGVVMLSVVLITTVLILFSVYVAGKVTSPLAKLTAAANELAKGNLDVELPPAGRDEVGSLTNSLSVTARYLKDYITVISDRAYMDSLTHVKNKAAYELATDRLNAGIAMGRRNFGIVVCDVNDLKTVNDHWGHDRGDDYLRTCCRLICDTFVHCPVYRIGGDEFAVILEGDSCLEYDALCRKMTVEMERLGHEEQPWQRAFLAFGAAFCKPADVSAADVFRRADKAMYENKRRMKGGIPGRNDPGPDDA